MNGRFHPPRRLPVPWGLVGFFLLAGSVEATLARHDVAFTDGYLSGWGMSRESRVREELRRAEVLCLGDSEVKDGVAPRVLERRLGVRAYNGGVIAGSPPMTYFILRTALAEGARPAAVLVDFSPHFLARDPLGNAQWGESARFAELLELAWTARDPGFFPRTAAVRLLQSYRRRTQIRRAALAALRGEPPAGPDELLLAQWRNWNVNRGAFLIPNRLQLRTTELDPAVRADLVPTPWAPHPVNVAYVRRLLALATGRGIPVYWLLPPVAPHIQAVYDQSGLDARLARFVRNAAAEAPGAVVLDGRRAGYPQEAFGDPIHLNVFGANAYSLDVAAVISDRRAGRPGPNWAALPAYRERPIEDQLEDYSQSWMARRGLPLPVRR